VRLDNLLGSTTTLALALAALALALALATALALALATVLALALALAAVLALACNSGTDELAIAAGLVGALLQRQRAGAQGCAQSAAVAWQSRRSAGCAALLRARTFALAVRSAAAPQAQREAQLLLGNRRGEAHHDVALARSSGRLKGCKRSGQFFLQLISYFEL